MVLGHNVSFDLACMVDFHIVLQGRVVSVGKRLDFVEIFISFLLAFFFVKVATRRFYLLVCEEVFRVFKDKLFFMRQSF